MSSTKFVHTKIWNNLLEKFVTNCPRGRHTRLLTTYDNSFTGTEAVSCLLKEFPLNPYNQQKLTREQALQLLAMMQGKKIFYRIGAKKGQERLFKDGKTLYFFKSTPQIPQNEAPSTPEAKKLEELNKADTWNIYSTSFFIRLAQFMPIDSFFSLQIRGEALQRNCESPATEEPYPAAVMKFLNFMKKTPFSRENTAILKGFFYFTKYIQSCDPLLSELEATTILDIFEHFSQGKWEGKSNELKTVSLLLLTLEPKSRHQLSTLLSLMTKIGRDESSGLYRSLVLEKFCSSIVPCDKISPRQGLLISQFLMDNFDELFQVDNELIKAVNKSKEETLKLRKSQSQNLPEDEIQKPVTFKKTKRSNELRDLMAMLNDLEKENLEEEKPTKLRKRASIKRNSSQKRRTISYGVFKHKKY